MYTKGQFDTVFFNLPTLFFTNKSQMGVGGLGLGGVYLENENKKNVYKRTTHKVVKKYSLGNREVKRVGVNMD